jgi:nitrate reductase NapE component
MGPTESLGVIILTDSLVEISVFLILYFGRVPIISVAS